MSCRNEHDVSHTCVVVPTPRSPPTIHSLYTHPPIPRLLINVRLPYLPTAYTAPNRLRLACAADLRRPHRRWLPCQQRALPPHLAVQGHKAKARHAVGGGGVRGGHASGEWTTHVAGKAWVRACSNEHDRPRTCTVLIRTSYTSPPTAPSMHTSCQPLPSVNLPRPTAQTRLRLAYATDLRRPRQVAKAPPHQVQPHPG